MTDLPTIAFIGLPLLTGCIGVGVGYWLASGTSEEAYWKAIAEREEARADSNHREIVRAARECNSLQDELDRVSDALAVRQSKDPVRGENGKFAKAA